MQDDLVLTVPEMARVLKIGRTLAWKMVWNETIKSVKVGRTVRVPMAAIEQFLNAGKPAGIGGVSNA